jgi:hypothetical protein
MEKKNMTHPDENPFSEFEDEYKGSEKAKPGSSIGRLPEHNGYRGVCTTVDLKGDGVMVDHDIFKFNTGTTGLKIFIEILEPENVGETTVRGEIHEHVWPITSKMLPYVKRDAATIIGKEVPTLGELAKPVWAGHTVEFGLKDDNYNNMIRSKVSFFNPWNPKAAAQQKESQKETKKAAGAAQAGKTEPKKENAKTQAAGAKSPNVDF